MTVLAIDPGPTVSAWVRFDGQRVVDAAIRPNDLVLAYLHEADLSDVAAVVIEQVESFGMAVGKDVFETVWWAGRFFERSRGKGEMLPRRAVKIHLCQTVRANDANIRQVLIDRFGGPAAVGTTKARGPLYGLRSHQWAAVALACTWWDGRHSAQEGSGATIGTLDGCG